MRAEKLTSDVMYILKCATMDYVLAKKSDSENMTSEKLRKVLAPFIRRKDKVIPKKENYLLICYCRWVHVEKRERRAIGVEKHNINAGNSTDFAYITISYHAEDGLVSTAINAVNLTDCSGDAADGLIDTAIKYFDSTDYDDVTISDDAVDGFIATDINYFNSTDCSDDAAGGLVTSIDAGDFTYCTGIKISDDAADEFIATDYGDSTDFADTNVSDDAVDVLMILVG